MSIRTILIALIGLAIAVALGTVAFRVEPKPVELHVLMRGPMEVTVNADGVTRVREVYEVAAPVSGIALRAPVRVGDAVVANETLVAVVQPAAAPILDARAQAQATAALAEARAAERAALADVHSAEEQELFAQGKLTRTATLVERGVSSLTALESATLEHNAALAALDAARSRYAMSTSSVDRAEAALATPEAGNGSCCREIYAPANGVVLRVETLSERPVAAGTPLLAVGDPTDLEIVADLLSSDAVQLPEQAHGRGERWGGAEALEVRLRRIDPVARTHVSALGIEEQRVNAVFDLLTPPEARLGMGENFGVFLRIVQWQIDDALRLPLSAAFRTGNGWAVFVAEDGLARLRAVELGKIGADTAQVLAGLSEGESVIVHPGKGIVDLTPIAPRASEPLN